MGEQGIPEGPETKSLEQLRDLYADMAAPMDRWAWLNRLATGSYRRRLFGRARGRVLDVACGLGMNVRYLPPECEYVGIDLSPDMLARARRRLGHLHPRVVFREMDAQHLDFEDASFDTVISSLSTCTFPDPAEALAEMERACRPEGRILLVEHGRSRVGLIAWFQDWRADAHYEKHGCRWNRDPVQVVEGAGLAVRDSWRGRLGIMTAIEAESRNQN